MDESQKVIENRIQAGCDIATGRMQPDAMSSGTQIVGAKRDVNASGNGIEWYRMVYRHGSWQYVSAERLPIGIYLAADRDCEVSGEVFPGEIIAQHDRRSPVDTAYLACDPVASGPKAGRCLTRILVRKLREGQLAFTLPDGSVVTLSDPRA